MCVVFFFVALKGKNSQSKSNSNTTKHLNHLSNHITKHSTSHQYASSSSAIAGVNNAFSPSHLGSSSNPNITTTSSGSNSKRLRTTILPEQQEYLMQKYQLDQNPSRKMLDEIAREVRLKKRVVQVWFQNTRARERKGIIKITNNNSTSGGGSTATTPTGGAQTTVNNASSTNNCSSSNQQTSLLNSSNSSSSCSASSTSSSSSFTSANASPMKTQSLNGYQKKTTQKCLRIRFGLENNI